jgi:formiminotetrahydrofolate cyclodeaminase
MLVDRSVHDLLAAFGSSDPTPGGGSASALASAVGTSLLMMVAGLPKTRAGSDENRTALQSASGALSKLRRSLTEAIDADTAAYASVVAAYRMPKGSVEEQQERKRAIQRALGGATEVPLGVMRMSAQALEQAVVVAAHGNRAAASDVGVAAALLRAGAAGARLNVETNLDGIGDERYRETARAEVRGLTEAVERSYLAISDWGYGIRD